METRVCSMCGDEKISKSFPGETNSPQDGNLIVKTANQRWVKTGMKRTKNAMRNLR